jgi:hypothetical protein
VDFDVIDQLFFYFRSAAQSGFGRFHETQTQKNAHNTNTKYSWPEYDSNPRSLLPRERAQFIP